MQRLPYLLSLAVILTLPWEKIATVGGLATLSKLGGMVLVFVWGIKTLHSGMRRPIAFHALVLAFVLWNLTSILWSVDSEKSMERGTTYLAMGVFALLLWDIYDSPGRVRAALQAFVLGLWVPILSTLSNFIAARESVYGRFSSSGDNANTTALILALGIPLAWRLAVERDTGRWTRYLRVLNFGYVPMAILCIALTATRFAMVMVLPALFFMLWSVRRLNRVQIALAVVVLGAGLVALASVVPRSSFERLGSTGDELTSGDLNGRMTVWRIGLEAWTEQPIAGVGAGAFGTTMIPYWGRSKSAHNSFVAVLVEVGVVGLVLWVALVATTFCRALRIPGQERMFWLTVLAVWGLGNLAMTWAHTKSTWLLLGLLVASSALSSTPVTPGGGGRAAGDTHA